MKFLYSNEAKVALAIASILNPQAEEDDLASTSSVDQVFNQLPSVPALAEKDYLKIIHCYLALIDNDDRLYKVVDVLTQLPSTKQTHQLQLLVHLYNNFPGPDVLVRIFKFARDVKLLDMLTQKGDDLLKDHLSTLTDAQRSEVLSILAEYNPAEFGLIYLKGCGKDAARAQKVIGHLLKQEFSLVFQISAISSVQALKDVHAVLEDIKRGAFEKLLGQKAAIQKLSPLTVDDCVVAAKVFLFAQKMRENVGKSLSYSEVAKALNVDDSLVEEYVITAIRFKAVGARLNQAKKQVEIGHVVPFVMDSQDWKILQTRLAAISTTLSSSQETLKQTIAGLEVQG